MFFRLLAAIVLTLLFLSGCNKDTTSNKSHEDSEELSSGTDSLSSSKQKEGTELKLEGVNKEFEQVFVKNFDIVKKGHEDLIYRKSEEIQRLSDAFIEDRSDLKSAGLVYDANHDETFFWFDYEPASKDLDISSNPHFMIINLASYFYIDQAVGMFFGDVKQELQKQGIDLMLPKRSVVFYVNDNHYLSLTHVDQFKLLLEVKLPSNEQPSFIEASFPTGTMKVAVEKPKKSVNGQHANVQALLEFFKTDIDTDLTYFSVNSAIDNKETNNNLSDDDSKHESFSERSDEKTSINTINEKTSKLSMNEYVEKVNKLSMEQDEYSILHRPIFREEEDYYIYNFIANTSEDIVIVTDMESFIKQVTWKSKELLNEEILFNIKWLILSLDDNISLEEVNEFLFHESLTEQKFGNFLVKLDKSDNGFNFNLLGI